MRLPAVTLPPRGATVLARLGLTERAVDPRESLFAFGKKAPKTSEDLERIAALPRRPRPTREEQAHMAEVMTAFLRRENSSCRCAALSGEPCITKLRPIQGWYLYEAMQGRAAIGSIIVGDGKTGIDILLAMALPAVRRAVLLIPANLREQFALDFMRWGEHFKVPNLTGGSGTFFPERPTLDVLSYSELSHPSGATYLAAQAPDLIIADECQRLKDVTTAGAGRFVRYFIEHPETAFVAHSGSLTTRSISDYAHLAALSLREGSPLPLDTGTVSEWAKVLDPGPAAPIGAMKAFCEVGETARSGFRRRLNDTAGIITTEDSELAVRLFLKERPAPPLPPPVDAAMRGVRTGGQRPDGEELVEAVEVAACLRQLAAGFFYRWKYPRGEPEALILEWFAKRQAWNRELRGKLEHARDLLDSPALCAAASERFEQGYTGELPTWASNTWAKWRDIAPAVEPVPEAVWLDDFLAADAVKFGLEAPGIIWYGHGAWGRRVASLGKFPLFGGGAEASRAIMQERGDRTIVASIKAHGTGKNLQAFSRALVGNPPADGGTWEQLLGRLHRQRQEKDVTFWVYRHTPEYRGALEKAKEDAAYVQQTTGKAEKLLYAETLFLR